MTERRPFRLGATELRLYAVALLALVYVAAWRVIRPPALTPSPALPETMAMPLAPVAVPRSNVAVPRVKADPARAKLVRAPISRPRRIRTRSS